MTSQRRILVAGASGVVGRAALAHFAAQPGWDAVGISRRAPTGVDAPHLSVDLSDKDATLEALGSVPPISHLVFAALFEKPGLLAGWLAEDQMAQNLALLRNCLYGLAAHPLEHVSLLQGTKAYGAHVRPMRIPGRERDPRVEHPNFYWLQEDLLRARAAEAGWSFTIWRPPVIFGHAVGAPMNVLAVLGVYAAICRESGEAFAFPGGACGPLDGVDARLLAEGFSWAVDADSARNGTFNITNGDVFRWPDLWPALADAFGVPTGPPRPRALEGWLKDRAELWDRIRTRHDLEAPALRAFLGDSLVYADMLLGHGRERAPPATLLSTIAIRQAGFASCADT
ncbi:MAG: SDR family oxidoreductase, partial [Pseudomonadales bacterium]|nr:SDR family oxidoreductase [Pseudomonadales bacterium]